jgi:hypothetical protein
MRRRKNPNLVPRRVDIVHNHDDHWCVILAMRGRSNRAIRSETGLSNGQISYRIKNYLQEEGEPNARMAYRDGTSAFAKEVDKVTEKLAEKALLKHLRTHVGKG